MRRLAATMAAMLPANFRTMAMKPHFRVAVMGDAHGDFLDGECAVLERVAKPDLFLAVGDFANEDAAIVRRIASATKQLSGAAHLILGNHDAWRSSRTGYGIGNAARDPRRRLSGPGRGLPACRGAVGYWRVFGSWRSAAVVGRRD